jgi:hypothetical protein
MSKVTVCPSNQRYNCYCFLTPHNDHFIVFVLYLISCLNILLSVRVELMLFYFIFTDVETFATFSDVKSFKHAEELLVAK